MRGLDPRIHPLASVASVCREDVDGRIKSGHDDCELRDGHCILGVLRHLLWRKPIKYKLYF